jgi:hypothetical protein
MILMVALQNDHDLMARRKEKQMVQNDALIEDIRLLDLEVERMKVDVRRLDRRVLDERVHICEIIETNEELATSVDDLEKKVLCLTEENEEKLHEIDTFAHVRYQALAERRRLGLVRLAISEDLSVLRHRIWSAVSEADLLKEKVRVYRDYIRIAAERFEDKRDEIKHLEEDISRALARQSQLMLNRKRTLLIEKECFRLDRIWIKTAALAITLEQEEEHPVNVHRWTMLKSIDPHMYALVQMRNSLTNKIGCQVAIHSRIQAELHEIKQNMGEIDLKLMIRTKTKHEESQALEERLRIQNRALEAVQGKLDDGTVLIEKQKVDKIKEMVHQRKQETTANYDAINSLRVVIQMPATNPPRKRAPGRFKIGGGFPVGDASRSCEPLPEIRSFDLARAASDRARSSKPVQIKAPVSARSQRPKTLAPGERHRLRGLLSARLPDEDL